MADRHLQVDGVAYQETDERDVQVNGSAYQETSAAAAGGATVPYPTQRRRFAPLLAR